jgi:hypothetical protein
MMNNKLLTPDLLALPEKGTLEKGSPPRVKENYFESS